MVNHDTAILGSKLVIPALNLSHKIVLIITITSVVTIYNPWVAFFGILILSFCFLFNNHKRKKNNFFKNTKKSQICLKKKTK